MIGIAVAAHASDTDSRITMGVGVTIPAPHGLILRTHLSMASRHSSCSTLLHDAVLKPMPSGPLTPSLAERSSASEDGVTYAFTLRAGAKFHSGEPVTARRECEVLLRALSRDRPSRNETSRVKSIEIVGGDHIRFSLTEPWPDFLTFYASATGAGWVVPKDTSSGWERGIQEGTDRCWSI